LVNFPPGEIKGTEAASGSGMAVTAGGADAADLDVALGIVRGVEVAAGVGDGSDGITLRGVILVSGVDVAATVGAGVADIVADGNGVGVTDADEAGVSAP